MLILLFSAAASSSALTLTPKTPGTLTLTAHASGVLTLTPRT